MSTIEELIGRVIISLRKAEDQASGLPEEILKMEGMSSPKVRHFLNNICSYPDTKYLEVGTAAGSTHISALYGNTFESVVASDLWVEIKNEGGKQAFLDNCQQYLGGQPTEEKSDWQLITGDCFEIDPSELPQDINVYFFDGGHEVEDHYKAIKHFKSALAKNFIMIIDDWNDHRVQQGTAKAIDEGDYNIGFSYYCKAKPGSTPPSWGDMKEWWNGLMILVMEKK